MSVGDILGAIGKGAATAGRVAGTVLEPVAKSIANEEAGYAPQIAAEKRQHQTQLEDAEINAKAQELENQLAMGEKYGTLTTADQQKYIDAITNLYSHPRHAATLMEKLRKAIHPQGAFAQGPTETLPSATPEGGTLRQDTLAAMMKAKPNYQNFRTEDGHTVTIDVNRQEPDPGWIKVGTATGMARSLGMGIGIDHAIAAMRATGQKFMKPDGTAYTEAELRELPAGMQLRQYAVGDKMYYGVADETQHTVTFGNQVYRMDQFGDVDTSQPLGPARVGTVTTQTSPGGAQVVSGTTAPVTPGAAASPATVPIPAGGPSVRPGPFLQTRPMSATPAGTSLLPPGQVRPVNPSRISSLPKVNRVGAGQSILPNIQNMTPRNAAMAQKTQPAATALLGLYGDPHNPSAPSMIDYVKLADDPHAQQVLGEAFKLLDQQMGEISDPGILQTLGTGAGWANFRAQAEAGAQQAAGTEMTPEERAYFDAAISSMADIIGSRSATGQSAARFSVRAIQNELPLIGLSGTPDSASYLTKMQTIGRQIRVGLNAMPDNSRAMNWLNQKEAEIAKQKSSVAATLGGGHTIGEVKTFPNGKKGTWDGTGWVAQ